VIDDIRRPLKNGVKVLLDSPFQLVERLSPVHLVFRDQVGRRFFEAETIIFAVIGMPSAIAPSRLRKRSRATSLFLLCEDSS
jgi:hypothetical protein